MTEGALEEYKSSPLKIRVYDACIAATTCVTVGGIAAFAVTGYLRYIILGLSLVALGLATRRSFQIALSVSRDTISIRNYWRTYQLPWTDVVEIGSALQTMGVVPQPAIYFLLKNGKNARARQRRLVCASAKRCLPQSLVWRHTRSESTIPQSDSVGQHRGYIERELSEYVARAAL